MKISNSEGRRQIAEPPGRAAPIWALLILHSAFCIYLAGCERNDMHNQPRHEPMEPSVFFVDGQSSRPLVPGTVARGQLLPDNLRFAGFSQEPPAETFPFEITRADLKRGQQRFEIYCAICHGASGDGDGMIVQRGFTPPPSFHEQRLRDAPPGHYFNVITQGWGAMYSYSDRVIPEDRWRIAAYIKVLQLSQKHVARAGRTDGEADPVRDAVERVITQPGQEQQTPQQPPRPPGAQQ